MSDEKSESQVKQMDGTSIRRPILEGEVVATLGDVEFLLDNQKREYLSVPLTLEGPVKTHDGRELPPGFNYNASIRGASGKRTEESVRKDWGRLQAAALGLKDCKPTFDPSEVSGKRVKCIFTVSPNPNDPDSPYNNVNFSKV